MSADALFLPQGDEVFLPTDRTRSPWGPESQHGGPPAALLARAVQSPGDDGAEMHVARLTIEILRPVPVAPLRLTSSVLRPGRKVQLHGASLTTVDGGVEVARAVALRIRRAEVDAPLADEHKLEPAPPRTTARSKPSYPFYEAFHNEGVEMRYQTGSFDEHGPVVVWIRLTQPVVEGEETTPLQRVAAAADFGNGVSHVLPFSDYLFINPDLSIHLARPPQGEWVALASRSLLSPRDGVGMAESELYDDRGRIGRSIQQLLVDRR